MILAGAAARVHREHELAAWLAWHIGALARVKKFPRLRDLLPASPDRQRKKADHAKGWESQFAAFASWAKSFSKG